MLDQCWEDGVGWVLAVAREKLQRRQWHPTPVLLPGKSHGWTPATPADITRFSSVPALTSKPRYLTPHNKTAHIRDSAEGTFCGRFLGPDGGGAYISRAKSREDTCLHPRLLAHSPPQGPPRQASPSSPQNAAVGPSLRPLTPPRDLSVNPGELACALPLGLS